MKSSEFIKRYASHPHYKAPRGTELHCKSWQTEAALRMLLNNLDQEVAEDPSRLVVYGGNGQAARSVEALQDIIKSLLELEDDESLLVQSGKAVGRVRSHRESPRVYIANSNLVPHWANWEHFNKLKEAGLMMYGQMTAGSWIYIGTQGILQGTYETFMACGKKHYNSDLSGKFVFSGGLGGMGGAQPLAATMAGAAFLGVDVDEERIQKRLHTRYLDRMTDNFQEAMSWINDAKERGIPLSVGLKANVADVLELMVQQGITPDVTTDQTSAHDPINGYVPAGLPYSEALKLREENPQSYREKSLRTMAAHVGHLLTLQQRGSHVFDYGNNLREFARQGGAENSFDYPGFVPAYIRPLFCQGKGPFRWVALSGDPDDIKATDEALMAAFPHDKHLIHWLNEAENKVAYQGLPSRICWLGMGEREKAGLIFNNLVKEGKVKAPIVIGRDHLDCGSVASPYRETESMKDGSDAVSDWPILNLLSNTGGGATWVSFHHGGGVGMGYSQHAGMVVVADGTERAEKALLRVLHNDPAMGIFRHADAGYQEAQEQGIKHNLIKSKEK